VNRLLIFAGALALNVTQPALSFAHPPPAVPPMPTSVNRAPLPDYTVPRPARPMGHPVLEPIPKFSPYPYSWPQWGWTPGFLSPLSCLANSGLWGPGALATPGDGSGMPDVTLGSLVDAQSRNFLTTSPSYGQFYGQTSLQLGFQPFGCGSSYSLGP
jgi:hypothetical protein